MLEKISKQNWEKFKVILDESITFEQFMKTNNKQLRNVLLILRQENNLSNDKSIILLSYKMYYILGYENTVELLKGMHGRVDLKTLEKMFLKCDIKEVEFVFDNNKHYPKLDLNLINFLIGNKKDNNTVIKKILKQELDIILDSFPYIYNNFNKIQRMIGDKIHLNALLPLLEKDKFLLFPNEYKLNNMILEKTVKAYVYSEDFEINLANKKTAEVAINQAREIYHNCLEKRIYSSIPRVSGVTDDNYSYEILKLDDPIIMTVGYETKSCFRPNGDAKDFFRFCCLNENARVLIIRNEVGEIIAFSPIIRNGNVIVGNSIERRVAKTNDQKIYNAYKQVMDAIIYKSKVAEQNPIVGAVVTDHRENVANYAQIKVNNNINPLYEGRELVTNYSASQYLVSIDANKNINDFKSYMPDANYMDERPNIIWGMNDNENIGMRVNSILFQKNKMVAKYDYDLIICGEDWFIGVKADEIQGEYLAKDWRAKEEFETTREYINELIKNDYSNLVNKCKSKFMI